MDGGSNDGSVEIIEKFANRIDYWESKPDRGQSHAINKGWRRATGEIIAWINSDDIYLPSAFQHVSSAFSEYPQAVAFIGACELTDRNHISIGKRILPILIDGEHILKGGDIPAQPSVFLNRCVIDDIGFLSEDLNYVLDWEYWLRIGLHYEKEKIILIDEVLSAFNTWQGGKTQSAMGKNFIERRRIYNNYYQNKAPKEFLQLKSLSLANTYWREARMNLENENWMTATKNFLKATLLNPSRYHPLRAIWVNADLLVPTRPKNWLKKLLRR